MMRNLIIALFVLLLALLLLYPLARARAQEHHERHHAYYQGWMNKAHFGCCNDQDCGELSEQNERTTAAGIEVRIEGEWCPVLPHHYLKQGNSPDWSTSHVCVQKGPVPRVCERLLCYQPKPGT
jgi:hypothetical protein